MFVFVAQRSTVAQQAESKPLLVDIVEAGKAVRFL